MNQQYLKGISSIMGSGESVIFPATEGNIISFLKMNQMAERSEIRTLDGKKFLTALKDAVIDICPDKAFLEDKIRPLLGRVKKGMEKVPKLQVIEENVLTSMNLLCRTGTVCTGRESATRSMKNSEP